MKLDKFSWSSEASSSLEIASYQFREAQYIPIKDVDVVASYSEDIKVNFGLYENNSPYPNRRLGKMFNLIVGLYNNKAKYNRLSVGARNSAYDYRKLQYPHGTYFPREGSLIYLSKVGIYNILFALCTNSVGKTKLNGIRRDLCFETSTDISILMSKDLITLPEHRYMFRNIRRGLLEHHKDTNILVVDDLMNTIYNIKAEAPSGRTISDLKVSTNFGNKYYFIIGEEERQREKERVERARENQIRANIIGRMHDVEYYLRDLTYYRQEEIRLSSLNQEIVLVDDTVEAGEEIVVEEAQYSASLEVARQTIINLSNNIMNTIASIPHEANPYLEVENEQPYEVTIQHSINNHENIQLIPFEVLGRFFVRMPAPVTPENRPDNRGYVIGVDPYRTQDTDTGSSYTVSSGTYTTTSGTDSQAYSTGIISQITDNPVTYRPNELNLDSLQQVVNYEVDAERLRQSMINSLGIPEDPALT